MSDELAEIRRLKRLQWELQRNGCKEDLQPAQGMSRFREMSEIRRIKR